MNVQPLTLNAMIPADGGAGHGVTIKKAAPCESRSPFDGYTTRIVNTPNLHCVTLEERIYTMRTTEEKAVPARNKPIRHSLVRSSPASRLVNAFDQVVEPLITEIT